jgi:hypothetical protein
MPPLEPVDFRKVPRRSCGPVPFPVSAAQQSLVAVGFDIWPVLLRTEQRERRLPSIAKSRKIDVRRLGVPFFRPPRRSPGLKPRAKIILARIAILWLFWQTRFASSATSTGIERLKLRGVQFSTVQF